MRPLSGGIGSGSASGPTWRPTAETPSSRWYHRGWCPEIDFWLLEMTPVATGQFSLGYKFHPGNSKWPEIHMCSRSRKPSSGRKWQDQPAIAAMAMNQNWDYTKGPTKHGWCLLFSIKPSIFCGWYLFSDPCPTPWYPQPPPVFLARVSRSKHGCQFVIANLQSKATENRQKLVLVNDPISWRNVDFLWPNGWIQKSPWIGTAMRWMARGEHCLGTILNHVASRSSRQKKNEGAKKLLNRECCKFNESILFCFFGMNRAIPLPYPSPPLPNGFVYKRNLDIILQWIIIWLVVSTPLKNMTKSLGIWVFP